jgi:O-antigen ligase
MEKRKNHSNIKKRENQNPLKFCLSLIIFSLINLGYISETLLLQYVFIVLGFIGYVVFSNRTIPKTSIKYILTKHMAFRWLFILFMVLSLFWSINPSIALGRIVTTAIIHIICIVVFDAVVDKNLMRFVLNAIFFSTLFCAVNALSSILKISIIDRPEGIYGNPNVVALISLLGLSVYLFHDHNLKSIFMTWIWRIAGSSLVVSVFLSSSRKGLVGFVFLCVFSLLNKISRKRLITLLVILIPVATIGFSVMGTRVERTFSHLNAITEVGEISQSDTSLISRATFIQVGLEQFKKAPLIGQGIESFAACSGFGVYSHNNYIEIAVSLGVVGLWLYYVFILQLALASVKKRHHVNARFYLAVITMILLLDVGVVSYYFKPWILIVIVVAGGLHGPKKPREKSNI